MTRKVKLIYFRRNSRLSLILSSFSVCLQEQNEHYTLAVIQKSSFMTFPLLTIPFRRATDAEMNSYLVRLIAEFKDTVGPLSLLSVICRVQFQSKLALSFPSTRSCNNDIRLT